MDARYYKELAKLSLLSDDEIQALFERVKLGDDKAINQIVESNLRLVVYYAKGYLKLIKGNDTLELSDLISEGNIGLIQAVKAYDPSKGTLFSYYASMWIKKEIVACLVNNLSSIRSPWHKQKGDASIKRMITKLENERFAEVDEQEIRNLGIYREDEIHHYFNKATVVPFPDGYEPRSDEEAKDEPEELKMIRIALKHLKPRERKVIRLYFGIDGEEKSLQAIGTELGIGKERVRQIKEKAIQKIRIIWGKKKLGLQP
jgi:RNA polymerase primary sigma factor